jgi:WD repeat-containing protein 55
MPDIPVGSQLFDFCFAPSAPVVFTGLLSGEIKAFSYDEQGQHAHIWSVRPSKKSCRGLAISADGERLFAVGKAKALTYVWFPFIELYSQLHRPLGQ